jgi:hypothetical protein
VRWSPASKDVSTEAEDFVRICYEPMASEGIEYLASAVVRSRMRELVTVLYSETSIRFCRGSEKLTTDLG